jgi:hypothetical protein
MKENTIMNFYDFYSEEIDAQVYFCGFDEEINFQVETNTLEDSLYKVIGKNRMASVFRGTSVDRLPYVIQNGIDSEQNNMGFWGNMNLAKCLEYGQIIMCFERTKCKSSWNEYELTKLSDEDLIELKSKFQSYEIIKDKTKIFLSMFQDKRRGAVHYEKSHGYYIPKPNSEKECLEALILLGCGEDWFTDLVKKFYISSGTLIKDGKYLIEKEKFKQIMTEAENSKPS